MSIIYIVHLCAIDTRSINAICLLACWCVYSAAVHPRTTRDRFHGDITRNTDRVFAYSRCNIIRLKFYRSTISYTYYVYLWYLFYVAHSLIHYVAVLNVVL